MMADGKGVMTGVTGSGKWEKFEDESIALVDALEGSSARLPKEADPVIVDTDKVPADGGVSPKKNISSKATPGVITGNTLENLQSEPLDAERDISTISGALPTEQNEINAVNTSKPLGHGDLKNHTQDNQAVGVSAGNPESEKTKKWTSFHENPENMPSVKLPDKTADSQARSSSNMVNGSRHLVNEEKSSASTTVAPPEQKPAAMNSAQSKHEKSWVSFGEEAVIGEDQGSMRRQTPNNSRAIENTAQTGSLTSDHKTALSADMTVTQKISALLKVENQIGTSTGSDSGKAKGWIDFGEKPQPVSNERDVKAAPSPLNDSWVIFEDAKLDLNPDLAGLTISVGLSPQASPLGKASPSPNPFINPNKTENPFKPPQGVTGTNPFQVNQDILSLAQLKNDSKTSSATEPEKPSPNTTQFMGKAQDEAADQITAADQLDNIATTVVAASSAPPVIVEEDKPLAEYPVLSTTSSWSLLLRFPDKKKRIGSREWKPVVIKLDRCTLQIYEDLQLSAPFREVPLQGYFAFSEARLQSHERGGKVHTVKLEYVKYTEGRKLSPKGNIEHIPSTTPILKLGSRNCFVVREFMEAVTHALRFLPFYRDRGITYHHDEMFVDVDDVCHVLLSGDGSIQKQGSKVLIKIRAFLTGDPECELILNDVVVKSREEERLRNEVKPQRVHNWIKLQQCEFHKCADRSKFDEAHAIQFHPLDACTFELMRFPVRNSKPLPLEVTASLSLLSEHRIELKAEIQLCQEKKMTKYARNNVVFRFPIPDMWVSLFKTSKLFRGEKAIKSTRVQKGGLKNRLHSSKCSIVVSLGSAKYEPEYAALVWRIEKLPFIHSKVPVDAPQTLTCRVELPAGMEYPADYKPRAEVEYDVSHALVSDTTVVSIKASNEILPEKWVCYKAFYHYDIEMDVVKPTSRPVRDVGCTQQ